MSYFQYMLPNLYPQSASERQAAAELRHRCLWCRRRLAWFQVWHCRACTRALRLEQCTPPHPARTRFHGPKDRLFARKQTRN